MNMLRMYDVWLPDNPTTKEGWRTVMGEDGNPQDLIDAIDEFHGKDIDFIIDLEEVERPLPYTVRKESNG